MNLTWGGYECIFNPEDYYQHASIECPEKEVEILLYKVREFMHTKKRMRVGWSTKDHSDCDIWEDETHIHIGCIKEEKNEFMKKYLTVLKNLNKNKNG